VYLLYLAGSIPGVGRIHSEASSFSFGFELLRYHGLDSQYWKRGGDLRHALLSCTLETWYPSKPGMWIVSSRPSWELVSTCHPLYSCVPSRHDTTSANMHYNGDSDFALTTLTPVQRMAYSTTENGILVPAYLLYVPMDFRLFDRLQDILSMAVASQTFQPPEMFTLPLPRKHTCWGHQNTRGQGMAKLRIHSTPLPSELVFLTKRYLANSSTLPARMISSERFCDKKYIITTYPGWNANPVA
jgi:hypothetical protein